MGEWHKFCGWVVRVERGATINSMIWFHDSSFMVMAKTASYIQGGAKLGLQLFVWNIIQ